MTGHPLSERDRLRQELLSSISHELRTPLTSVMGYTEVLLSGDAGDLNEQQVAMLERVALNGDRLLHLIEALLSAATGHSGESRHVEVVDLLELVCRLIDQPQQALAADVPTVVANLGRPSLDQPHLDKASLDRPSPARS